MKPTSSPKYVVLRATTEQRVANLAQKLADELRDDPDPATRIGEVAGQALQILRRSAKSNANLKGSTLPATGASSFQGSVDNIVLKLASELREAKADGRKIVSLEIFLGDFTIPAGQTTNQISSDWLQGGAKELFDRLMVAQLNPRIRYECYRPTQAENYYIDIPVM